MIKHVLTKAFGEATATTVVQQAYRHKRRYIQAAIAAALYAMVAACDGDGDGEGVEPSVNIAGSWRGASIFPNGFTTSMNLEQSGSSVSGTMTVSGSFIDRPLVGNVDESGATFAWSVARDCEIWTGVLTIELGANAMDGPLMIDRTGCTGNQSNSSGTLSLTRQ